MTPDTAIQALRRLEAESSESWPFGYEPERVKAEATAALVTLEAHVEALPKAEQPAAVRGILRRVFGPPEYTATVPLRKRRAG